MKCIILAAGYATRLYPLTENFPKPLLEVCGKTILDRLIDDISSSGDVDEFVTVTNHKFAPHFKRWAEGRNNITVADDGTTSAVKDKYSNRYYIVQKAKNKEIADYLNGILGNNENVDNNDDEMYNNDNENQ